MTELHLEPVVAYSSVLSPSESSNGAPEASRKGTRGGRPRSRRARVAVWVAALLCFAVAVAAPLPYLTQSLLELGRSGGQIAAHFSKQTTLFQTSLVVHAATGGLALLLTPLLLSTRVRRRNPKAHRVLGRVGGVAMIIAGVSGVIVAQVSYAGWVGRIGFTLLSIRWLQTTLMSVRTARAGQMAEHRRWAIRGAACTFAAVTLRLQLGVMIAAQLPQSDAAAAAAFDRVYWVTSFLSWVPNVIAAEWWLRRKRFVWVN